MTGSFFAAASVWRRLAVLAFVLGAAAFLAPGQARGGTAGVYLGTLIFDARGDGNVTNSIGVSYNPDDGRYYVTDIHPIYDDQNCYTVDSGQASCVGVSSILIWAGAGNDIVTVYPGVTISAALQGGGGKDVLTGGDGPDKLWGSCSYAQPGEDCRGYTDTLYGGPGNDQLYGGGETPVGGGAADILHGNDGSDALHGRECCGSVDGADGLYGDAGNDSLDGGPGGDSLSGGSGKDIADYSSRSSAVSADIDGYADDGAVGEGDNVHTDVEGIQGGSGKDTLYGNDGANTLKGGGGNDYLEGYGGKDFLNGQDGNDILRGGLGADTLFGGSGKDIASWALRSAPITASLDGLANDGEAGEGDNAFYDVEGLRGGSAGDTLTGSPVVGETLEGLDGNDKLQGLGSCHPVQYGFECLLDTLDGGNGNDVLSGGPAGSYYDHLIGGAGTDTADYSARTDPLVIYLDPSHYSGSDVNGEDDVIETDVENAKGGSGHDALVGNSSANTLFGLDGPDYLVGGAGADALWGWAGDDTLEGDNGADLLVGGDHSDTLDGGTGGDFMYGGTGVDTADYSARTAPVTVTIDGGADDGVAGEGDDVAIDVENVFGGSAGDHLTGSSSGNVLYGFGGDDTLNGLDGGDTFLGGPGGDVEHGGAGEDRADYSAAPAAVQVDLSAGTAAGEGSDTLATIEDLTGSSYADVLTGDSGPNVIAGGPGNDLLKGLEGSDFLSGKEGDDTLVGGKGDDTLFGDPGNDTADFSTAAAGVTANLSTSSATGQGTDTLVSIEKAIGSPFADTITGTSGPNTLLGKAGNDKLSGLAGPDTLDGGDGTDTLDGGADPDTCLNGETLISCP